ncbi:xanthine dehydrogenase family protein molybdopterin-binding subunit [Acidipila sp. EB88]|uniref:xanthine dehydrogenase family protein molybdopterin-binding subunit n=1 Tax=Acidipila sp. EB88 TaxID=2305226 RepID=UPI000F5E5C75|nr:xanthine dehydrogenase family protein molybdopterin-binding subunit [Acidipila sp. EB88]RRA49872.1 xanthine dehydrogenase family protein molybdopterin-binding subunit [Acidipila sp. EB88]
MPVRSLTSPANDFPAIRGKHHQRVDGRDKVTGAARYAGDVALPGMLHAVLVQATTAHAHIQAIHAGLARSAPGVAAVFTGATLTSPASFSARDGQQWSAIQPPPEAFTANFPAERRAPFADAEVHYYGQHVALVVARTLLEAQAAAALVQVDYQPLQATLTLEPALPGAYQPQQFATNSEEKLTSSRGTPPVAPYAQVARQYRTPVVHHNPLEPSATVASWAGDALTLHESTRWVQGSQRIIAHMLSVAPEKVHVVSPFVGGAFGSKGFLWQHSALAAHAARVLGRPVKLLLTRAQMFTSTGHRPETIQDVVLSASADGSLCGTEHHTLCDTSPVGHFVEPCGMTTRNLYRTPFARIGHTVAPIHRATPCFMRAPGESSGMFALETAVDELAETLNLDPVLIRLRNDTLTDHSEERPFSSRHLGECLERGAALFGWKQRSPAPRSMRRDGKLVGWGVASAAYPARRSPATVEATVTADGWAVFRAATHEIGCGTATVMQQVAADALGWPADRVRFLLGDSSYPEAPVAGASMTVATVSPAVDAAAQQLRRAIIAAAARDLASPLFGSPGGQVQLRDGVLSLGSGSAARESATDVLARLPGRQLHCRSRAQSGPRAKTDYTFHSFGAHFAEVTWEPATMQLRVTRWVSVMDCGRVLNPATSRSQIQGGILFGLGMALLEKTIYDPATGAPLNDNLAEYHLPTCRDIPDFTVDFIEHPDFRLNPLGVRGIGEIGITGAPAALANAVYHATGLRLRELPLTVDKLLAAGL